MTVDLDFINALEAKVAEQLSAQRVGYLLAAGSSHLNGTGYSHAFELWDRIKDRIADRARRGDIQAKLALQRKVTSYTSPYSGHIDAPFS